MTAHSCSKNPHIGAFCFGRKSFSSYNRVTVIDISKTYRSVFTHAAFFIVLTFVLNEIGLLFDLYYIFPWFDILTHGIGGIGVGYLSYALLMKLIGQRFYATNLFWISWVVAVLFLLIGWEVYELFLHTVGLRFVDPGWDTVIDVVMGFIGAVLALVWCQQFLMYRKTEK